MDPVVRRLGFGGEHFTLDNQGGQHYLLHSIGRAGRLTGKEIFLAPEKNRTHGWYREGSLYLIQKQQKDGAWKSANASENPIVATSYAPLFLSQGKEK